MRAGEGVSRRVGWEVSRRVGVGAMLDTEPPKLPGLQGLLRLLTTEPVPDYPPLALAAMIGGG